MGAALIGARLVRDVMHLCFLMERQYAPYPKWFGTAFKQLSHAASLAPVLQQALSAGSWQEREEQKKSKARCAERAPRALCYAFIMEQQRGRSYKTLGVVVLLALLYGGWIYTQRTITGIPRLDGVIGVLLGLFICSRPAANMLDLLFAARRAQSSSSEWSSLGWLGLNLAVLFVGWIVVTIGATRLIARAP